MYAVIETGGRQYRVAEGDTVRIETIPGVAQGEEVTFDKVLLLGGEKVEVGTPTVPGATVRGRVVRSAKGRKIIVFKKIRREQHRHRRGHRQSYLEVKIEAVEAGAGGEKK
jgi:large subunit ribosomal protein L21